MKTIIIEHDDMLTSLVLDQIFKILLLKVDDMFANTKRVVSQAVELQSF